MSANHQQLDQCAITLAAILKIIGFPDKMARDLAFAGVWGRFNKKFGKDRSVSPHEHNAFINEMKDAMDAVMAKLAPDQSTVQPTTSTATGQTTTIFVTAGNLAELSNLITQMTTLLEKVTATSTHDAH